jgi:hypothetical protein
MGHQLGFNVTDRGVLPAFIPGALQTGEAAPPPGATTGCENRWTFIEFLYIVLRCFVNRPVSRAHRPLPETFLGVEIGLQASGCFSLCSE